MPPVDLSSFTVGGVAKLNLTQAAGLGGVSQGLPGSKRPTLRLHNESGSGLSCRLNTSGQSFNLPAGGWQDCFPTAGDNELDCTVLYVLPSPPVTLLLSTYYYPGETVPPVTTLGNSPIGIGGTVTTVGGVASSIANDNNAPTTPIVEATATGSPSSNVIMDNAGNDKRGVMIAGTLFKIFQLIANPPAASTEVLLGTGQNGNIVESRDLIQADAGVEITGGNLALLAGTLTRVTIAGPFTVVSGGTSCAHGLGAVPDFVIPVSDVGSFASASTGYGINFGTMTTTNVTVYSSSAGGIRTWLLSVKK